jgi:hypothetical protein
MNVAHRQALALLTRMERSKVRPLHNSLEEARLPANAFHRGTEFITEMTQVETAHIPPLDAFELVPDALARIELRGIRRQTLQLERKVSPERHLIGPRCFSARNPAHTMPAVHACELHHIYGSGARARCGTTAPNFAS